MRSLVFAASGLMLTAITIGGQAGGAPHRPGETVTVGGITFVAVPGGEFVMGDSSGPAIEQPAHSVKLDGFWIARTELTLGQWQAFVDGSRHPRGRSNGAGSNYPVVGVRWDDARAYCEWFSRKYAVIVRLPTEAEWEYAARGGLQAEQYPNGDTISSSDANYGSKGPLTVASFPPNGYGLYDMAGNVSEWVADWYDPNYYGRSPRENPRGPETDTNRLQRRADRGGGWCLGRAFARVSARHAGPGNWDEGGTADCLGFRPVMESPPSRR